jgi:HNH endonuclease
MLNPKVKQFVFERAGYLCEYCLSPMAFSLQPYVGEHIVPTIKNGTDDLDNLASACGGCNGHKFTKTEALDPVTRKKVPLFHPRTMIWKEHFMWSDDFLYLLGITDIGRATVHALYLNRMGVVNIRRILLLDGKHPAQK